MTAASAADQRLQAPSGFLSSRTVHIHPTLRCNLACRHCYSRSLPGADIGLRAAPILEGLRILWTEGYRTVSLSGGEPLLYTEISQLAEGVKALGFHLTAITNGSPLRPSPLLRLFDGIAVSLDGLEATHNAIRGNPKAFKWAIHGLETLRQVGTPSALAVCVTRRSLRELPAIAEIASNMGARALQLRPLVETGRASEGVSDLALSRDDLSTLVVAAMSLRIEHHPDLPVHLDVASAASIRANRASFDALLGRAHASEPLSSLVNPLVITEEGFVQPFTYDFPPQFRLGRLGVQLREEIDLYKGGESCELAKTVNESFRRLASETGFVDWYDQVRRVAIATGALTAA